MQRIFSSLSLSLKTDLGYYVFRQPHTQSGHSAGLLRNHKHTMSNFVDKAEELDVGQDQAGRGRSGGRGGRGGKRGGGGGSGGREVMVSKALSKLLRHAAVEAGLKLDAEGFASVEQVVRYTPLLFTESPCKLR